ncbi:MAG: hypothetical protein RKO66_09410 [Candidatus Contendobacter sp.]|nr:hypothetical protein [Candidatus Contendobacter sp.]MDS4059100.1 hypothetical protein [Candidatus Contendobacter sp.]
MAKHPFRHPTRISETHGKLLLELKKLEGKSVQIEEKKDSLYGRFRDAEANRYKSASDYHCCYCGEKRDRLDLDHFRPKGTPKHQHPRSDLLKYYRLLAGKINQNKLSQNKLPERKEENFFVDYLYQIGYAELCIDQNNIVPACPDCNTGGKNIRDFADRPHKFGKLNRFPVKRKKPNLPLLLHPGEVSWEILLDYFDFIDLADARLEGAAPWSGTVRATIVIPRFEKTDKIIKAATAIEIFGLNRKALSEQRFRMRQLFRGILRGAANSAKIAKGDPQSPTQFVKQHIPLHAAAFAIRAFICENPHKLALLDVLREWLGNEFSRIENLDRFLSPTL